MKGRHPDRDGGERLAHRRACRFDLFLKVLTALLRPSVGLRGASIMAAIWSSESAAIVIV
jgi:hypothetical protein